MHEARLCWLRDRQISISFGAAPSLCIAGKQEVVKSLLRLLANIQQHAYAGQHHEQA
jgi:hypothetical protein